MLLESQTQYLVLHDVLDTSKRKLNLAELLPEAIEGWTPGSRISPIWAVRGSGASTAKVAGRQQVLFLGPVQPARLTSAIRGLVNATDVSIWLSAGCFNVILLVPDDKKGSTLVRQTTIWAKAHELAYEVWRMENGIISTARHHTLPGGNYHSTLDNLAKLIENNSTPLLQTSFQELLSATASSLSRASTVHKLIFKQLTKVAESTCDLISAYEKGKLTTHALQSRLLSMNAALSRFSSQAFAGIPPIQRTECHFWIHSLLGTGSANLALANLVGSIQSVLGEARLPERLAALETKTNGVFSADELVSSTTIPNFDIMRATEQDQIGNLAVIPLVTYFSGRDGFSSQLQTLSAPLTTLAECNSLRSNILTVTHEISHVFIHSALSFLSPSLGEDAEADIEAACRIAQNGFRAQNQLDAARQLLIEAVITMEDANRTVIVEQLRQEISRMFEHWRNEIQEILVHTFDFLYFHQSNPEYYVTSIWHSWCSIPGISSRVPEYLMRTLCAISATLLGRKNAEVFDASVAMTGELLRSIKHNVDQSTDYIKQARKILRDLEINPEFRAQFEEEFYARLYLVRLVRVFLYSERLAARLFWDPHTRASGAEPAKKKLNYNTIPIGNGLTFLKDQLRENPTAAESIWVLHCLAFDLVNDEVGL